MRRAGAATAARAGATVLGLLTVVLAAGEAPFPGHLHLDGGGETLYHRHLFASGHSHPEEHGHSSDHGGPLPDDPDGHPREGDQDERTVVSPRILPEPEPRPRLTPDPSPTGETPAPAKIAASYRRLDLTSPPRGPPTDLRDA